MKMTRIFYLCILSAILLAFTGCTQEDTKKALSPLPVRVSEYVDASWQKRVLATPSLPEDVKHTKYIGEKVWVEVFARDGKLLYVRRNIYYRPSFFGPTDLKVQTIIMAILEQTAKREISDFNPAFHRWMGQAVRDAVHGNQVDTQFDDKGLSVRLTTQEDDLILEVARSTTMHSIEKMKTSQ